MKKNVLFLLFALLASGPLISCDNEKETEEPQEPAVDVRLEEILTSIACTPDILLGQKDDILGKWLLIQSRYGLESRELTDRSCEGIIYHFLPGNRLVITADDTHHLNGEYEYTYRPWTTRLPGPNLFIPIPGAEFGEWRCLGGVYDQYLYITEGSSDLWGETFLRIE